MKHTVASLAMLIQGVLPGHGCFSANMQDLDGAAIGSIFKVMVVVQFEFSSVGVANVRFLLSRPNMLC
jgi:hypothetical protein